MKSNMTGTDGRTKAPPPGKTPGGSTQHERNTALPASFASDLDASTIDFVVFMVTLSIVYLVREWMERNQKRSPPE
jgi:hypothetical protein